MRHHSQTLRVLSLTLAVLLLAAMALPTLAGRGDDADRKSKNGKAEGTIDGIGVVVEFGSPQVQERAVWGKLVPNGKVWRTGADEATTITFDKDATVGGHKVAAGTYGLFTVPGDGEWTIVLNSVAEQWGAYDYAKDKDVVRFSAKPMAGEHVEAMDFVIDGDSVVLRWEKVKVAFKVAAI
jgi:hypothetical protein